MVALNSILPTIFLAHSQHEHVNPKLLWYLRCPMSTTSMCIIKKFWISEICIKRGHISDAVCVNHMGHPVQLLTLLHFRGNLFKMSHFFTMYVKISCYCFCICVKNVLHWNFYLKSWFVNFFTTFTHKKDQILTFLQNMFVTNNCMFLSLLQHYNISLKNI